MANLENRIYVNSEGLTEIQTRVINEFLENAESFEIDPKYNDENHQIIHMKNGDTYYFDSFKYIYPLKANNYIEVINNNVGVDEIVNIGLYGKDSIRVEHYIGNNEMIRTIYRKPENIENLPAFLLQVGSLHPSIIDKLEKVTETRIKKSGDRIVGYDREGQIIYNEAATDTFFNDSIEAIDSTMQLENESLNSIRVQPDSKKNNTPQNNRLTVTQTILLNEFLENAESFEIDPKYNDENHQIIHMKNGDTYYFDSFKYIYPLKANNNLEVINNNIGYEEIASVGLYREDAIRVEHFVGNNEMIRTIYRKPENIENLPAFLLQVGSLHPSIIDKLEKMHETKIIKSGDRIVGYDREGQIIYNEAATDIFFNDAIEAINSTMQLEDYTKKR